MKLIETVITETSVRVRLAMDANQPLTDQNWIECQLLRSGLKRLSGTPAANLDALPLPTVRQVILENARAAIDAEIARLTNP
jgi:hypothetical protein